MSPGRAVRRKVSKLKACTEKTRYTEHSTALWAAKDYARKHPVALPRVPYPCPFGKKNPHYHIGTEINVPKHGKRL